MTAATLEEIAAYASMPIQIEKAIERLSEAQLQHTPAEGEWSIHEVLIHLADSEAVGYWRLRKTLAERDSVLALYDEEAWSKSLYYRQQDSILALRLFSDLRAANASLFKFLPAEAWELTSIHAERGKMSLYEIFRMYVEHGEIHLQQIERLKA
ncbi:hypothetical protein KDA_38660 [Dictyobacter alpinus]|uniref:DinB-like domain-containing protein n=1 Tax=Dictyobacter alpinus TaxID=2014873 RepID=A0A402BAR5_9CHLR|nr:DinB family protein [Dictyobacter alpinus]GCE28382.1 hypothetical protein KDA_38660 [Dictyobacter alpinus]